MDKLQPFKCGTCKYFVFNDDDPSNGFCKSTKTDIVVDTETCKKFEINIGNCFFYHFYFIWDNDTVYFTTDFEGSLKITRHLARYYLLNILTYKKHQLFRVMISNKGYYIKRDTLHYTNMKKFARDGLCKLSKN